MNKPQDPIRINDKEYKFDELPQVAQTSIISIQKIDGTLNSLSDQMELLQMARLAYINRLNETLKQENDNAVQEQTEEGVQPQSAAS